MKVSRGLVIKAPWSQLILKGHKSWEIRGAKTNIRGRIAIIESGTKRIYGYVDLVDCIGPLTDEQMNQHIDKHQIVNAAFEEAGPKRNMPYPRTYAWVLANPTTLKRPKPYKHPPGAIIWVDLEKQKTQAKSRVQHEPDGFTMTCMLCCKNVYARNTPEFCQGVDK